MAAPDGPNPLRDPRDRRLPRIAGPCTLIIFGVTGDLSRKKVMPAIYDLHNRGLLPPSFSLVGFARRQWEHEDFAAEVHSAVREHSRTEFREEVWEQMCAGIRFVPGDIDDDAAFDQPRLDRGRPGPGAGHGREPGLLLRDPAPVLRTHRPAAAAQRAGPASGRLLVPGRHREAVRARPAVRPGAQRPGGVGVRQRIGVPHRPLPGQGDGAEPAWRSGSRTTCSSRSGTTATWTMSRSRWPRTSASAAAPGTTTGSARRATSSRTTCCS